MCSLYWTLVVELVMFMWHTDVQLVWEWCNVRVPLVAHTL